MELSENGSTAHTASNAVFGGLEDARADLKTARWLFKAAVAGALVFRVGSVMIRLLPLVW